MVWQIWDWATIGLLGGLLVLGVRMVGSGGRIGSRRTGALLILAALGGLATHLPRLIGGSRGIRLAFDVPALVLVIAGFLLVSNLKGSRRTQ